MTLHEAILYLSQYEGPCGRICCYCPDDLKTAEVKECMEKAYKEIYKLQADKDKILEDLVKVLAAYRLATGKDYSDENSESPS